MMIAVKIAFENTTIDCNVQYGHGKKISIHIDSIGFVTVKVPNGTSDEIIMRAVEHHSMSFVI